MPTRITRAAEDQYVRLIRFWLGFDPPRFDAAENLRTAYRRAVALIDAEPGRGDPVPRIYPRSRKLKRLGQLGFRWNKVGRYWFAHVVGPDGQPVLTGVHLETEQIPSNVSSDVEPIGDA